MQLSVEQPVSGGYQLEVSGWDRHETFFVDNSELSWDEKAGKRVGLRHIGVHGICALAAVHHH